MKTRNAKALLLAAVLANLPSHAQAHEETAAKEMAIAANNLIASFASDAMEKLVFAMDDEHRTAWHYVPMERKGVSLKLMTPQQRNLATALLAASLSSQGLLKASTIMSLEQVLQTLEGADRRFSRDPLLYYVSIFGDPALGKAWAWRFEGHHLSLSFTVTSDGHISGTPSMMGANPAIVPKGPLEGLQVLADEELLGRRLARSLSAQQRTKAILSEQAPDDMLTTNQRKISPLQPDGIGWNDLDAQQQRLLWKLTRMYVNRLRGPIAQADLQRITAAGKDKIHFAWAGGLERGEPHYYRIQGPTFLVEYDNTQNNANHIHTVYRDFSEDFGEDLLKKHYSEEHSAGD